MIISQSSSDKTRNDSLSKGSPEALANGKNIHLWPKNGQKKRTYLSGGYEDSGLQEVGWGWQPAVAPVASLGRLSPGWNLDFLSAQTLATVPCF